MLIEFLKNNLDIDNIYADGIGIQRAQEKTRQMVGRFLRYWDREDVFSRAKTLGGTGMGISANLPRSIVETRKKLMDKFKAAKRERKEIICQ